MSLSLALVDGFIGGGPDAGVHDRAGAGAGAGAGASIGTSVDDNLTGASIATAALSSPEDDALTIFSTGDGPQLKLIARTRCYE